MNLRFLTLGVSFCYATALSLSQRATTCNGHAELCTKSFGEVSFVGAHNSYAVGVNNLAASQDQDVTQQLNDGIRMLQMQAHKDGNDIKLCHSSCKLYDGGLLKDYLSKVKSWLDSNPNEVISLLIVNIDNLPPSQFATAFTASGVDTVSFTPEAAVISREAWPTLGSLIDSGKRVVVFMDNQADFSAVPYIIDEFTNLWETAFDVTDPAFDCNINRTRSDAPEGTMYLINHFLDKVTFGAFVPDMAKLNVTNAASGAGSLGEQVQACTAQHSKPPNFLLVDYYEFGGGGVFQVAATINGVSYSPTSPIATPKPTTSTTAGANPSNAAMTKGRPGLNVVPLVAVAVGMLIGGLVAL